MGNPEESMPHRVLVVDDEANILLSLEFLMKKAGYEVCTARDGDEALAELRKALPDLVLLDVMMPKRNGFDVCEIIRANPEWKHVRVIMLTAKGRDLEREKGLAVGADDYITKPFSTREVVERVSGWLAAAPGPAGRSAERCEPPAQ
jgi:DNA-binding response OmpR family regulator